MLKVTIRYSSNIFDYPNNMQKILAKHNVLIIKTKVGEFKTKVIFHIRNMDKLNDLMYELNEKAVNQVVVVKIKDLNNKTSIGQRVLLWFLCLFAGIGFGKTIMFIMEAIVKWLV